MIYEEGTVRSRKDVWRLRAEARLFEVALSVGARGMIERLDEVAGLAHRLRRIASWENICVFIDGASSTGARVAV